MKAKLTAVALLITLSGCTGGGDNVVSGFGNSGNFFGVDAATEMLARALSKNPNLPEVSDEDLSRVYGVIREAAFAGDIRSSVVIYRLASLQREANEE